MVTTRTDESGASRHSVEINWALILNILLLMVIIFGAWFTTFSGPINEKFFAVSEVNKASITALAARIDAQFTAQEKAVTLAISAVENTNKETDASLARRFAASDKKDDEFRQTIRDLMTEIEHRRVEVATKSDMQALLQTTRLEFIAEIKRVDERRAAVRDEIQSVWKLREGQFTDLQRQMADLMRQMHEHEREDRNLSSSSTAIKK